MFLSLPAMDVSDEYGTLGKGTLLEFTPPFNPSSVRLQTRAARPGTEQHRSTVGGVDEYRGDASVPALDPKDKVRPELQHRPIGEIKVKGRRPTHRNIKHSLQPIVKYRGVTSDPNGPRCIMVGIPHASPGPAATSITRVNDHACHTDVPAGSWSNREPHARVCLVLVSPLPSEVSNRQRVVVRHKPSAAKRSSRQLPGMVRGVVIPRAGHYVVKFSCRPKGFYQWHRIARPGDVFLVVTGVARRLHPPVTHDFGHGSSSRVDCWQPSQWRTSCTSNSQAAVGSEAITAHVIPAPRRRSAYSWYALSLAQRRASARGHARHGN